MYYKMSKDIEHVYGNMPSQFLIVYLHNIYHSYVVGDPLLGLLSQSRKSRNDHDPLFVFGATKMG